MYKAKIEIGGYKVGETVPSEKAIIWESMYVESPVELVSEKKIKKVEETVKSNEVPEEVNLLDDYLARNGKVVIKSLSKDNIGKDDLDTMLLLEETGKKRSKVISCIKDKLKSLK